MEKKIGRRHNEHLEKKFYANIKGRIKECFYYIRDEQRKPVVTVCLIDDGRARGIAICSDSDNPCKATGRAIAREMAVKALFRKGSGEPVIREEAIKVLRRMGVSPDGTLLFKGKYAYRLQLTAFEEKLLEERKEDHPFRVKEMTYETCKGATLREEEGVKQV